jgi:hypothetical protein
MSKQHLLANFARSTLEVEIDLDDTVLRIVTVDIPLFPTVGANQVLKLILWDGKQEPEIVGCISNPGDGTLTVERGQEGTSAKAWDAGTQVRHAVTKETFNWFASQVEVLHATSDSSVEIGTGAKTFETQSGKLFQIGSWVLISDDGNPSANYMYARVVSYSGTTLEVDSIITAGSGTHDSWTIQVSGPPGAIGNAGLGFTLKGAWADVTEYAVNDVVANDGSSYGCTVAHTSGASTEPGTGGSWATVWTLLASIGEVGPGTGDTSTDTATSVDGEAAVFKSTTGKLLKRFAATGIVKAIAGVLSAAVEGTDYYKPGGTDVAVADGGSGASTAAGARTNFGLGTAATKATATAAEIRSATADRVPMAAELWSAADFVTVGSASSITLNFSSGFNFFVDLAHNATFNNPSNVKNGQSGVIVIQQDGGSKIPTFGSAWKFQGGIAPTFSVADNAVDVLCYVVRNSSNIYAWLAKDMK